MLRKRNVFDLHRNSCFPTAHCFQYLPYYYSFLTSVKLVYWNNQMRRWALCVLSNVMLLCLTCLSQAAWHYKRIIEAQLCSILFFSCKHLGQTIERCFQIVFFV